MFGSEALKATRQALSELSAVVKRTRQTLAALLQESTQASPLTVEQGGRFSDALEHLGDVREGFILSQRTASKVDLTELRDLVRHILTDWQSLEDLNIVIAPNGKVEVLGQQLIFYNHALIALAMLPRLPDTAITFPQLRPTYGDVTVPALPGEILTRIEEIEQTIYQAEFKPVQALAYGPLRRTYAFFEASSWLVDNHLAYLLGD